MPRNLDRRVEIVFPVEDEELKKKARHILDLQLADTMKAHCLMPDNTYQKVDKRGKVLLEAQMEFCKEAMERNKEQPTVPKRRFEPGMAPENQ